MQGLRAEGDTHGTGRHGPGCHPGHRRDGQRHTDDHHQVEQGGADAPGRCGAGGEPVRGTERGGGEQADDGDEHQARHDSPGQGTGQAQARLVIMRPVGSDGRLTGMIHSCKAISVRAPGVAPLRENPSFVGPCEEGRTCADRQAHAGGDEVVHDRFDRGPIKHTGLEAPYQQPQ